MESESATIDISDFQGLNDLNEFEYCISMFVLG